MNLTTLEQIVGPIKRGQLAEGFLGDLRSEMEKSPCFIGDDDHKPKPPPLTEDLSYMNGRHTKVHSERAKKVWKNMPADERKKRTEHLSRAGFMGGSATKKLRHLHGI
jgi:hypothetical protein